MAEVTVQDQVMERAAKDEAFRQQVISNARQVLADEYDVNIPANISIQVVENTSTNIYIVLPPRAQVGRMQELSDGELEAVAGGMWSVEMYGTYICFGG